MLRHVPLLLIATRARRSLLTMVLVLTASLAISAEYEIDGRQFSVFPSEPSSSQPIVITTLSSPCGGVVLETVDMVTEEDRIRIALR